MYRTVFFSVFCFFSLIYSTSFGGESKFVILICSYNNVKYVKKNILSALSQSYNYFRVIYVDDASTDGTDTTLQSVLDVHDLSHKVKVIRNEHRQGTPLANHYYTIHQEVADDEIVVLLDGDDCLAHQRVLSYLDRVYSHKQKIWMTYGQYRNAHSGTIGCCCDFPKDIVRRGAFREYPFITSHVKTFYAWLFKKICLDDLLYEGTFYKMAGDVAIMLPMIEMAKNHYKCIYKILYLYNEENPLNDHRVCIEQQDQLARYIRSRPHYTSLD